jgi:hypothetical protein
MAARASLSSTLLRARKAARIVSPRPGDAGRQIHSLTGQQVQLTQESPRPMTNDDLLLAVGTDQDLDCSREDHVEVIGDVPLSVEILAGGHRPPGPERLEHGKLGVSEGGRYGGVVSRQVRMVVHCFALLLCALFRVSRCSVLKARDLGQIALIFYMEELSESSRKLDTNVLYLTDGDRFSEDPKYDASVQRRVWQVDTLSLTHQLEKFVQGQFCSDSRIW